MSRRVTYYGAGKVSQPGLYTIPELNDMINNNGYIPVASENELNGLRNNLTQPMGVGTQWEGNYLTGIDKKYVQVKTFEVTVRQEPFGTTVNKFSGIYDGNKLLIDKYKLQIYLGAASNSPFGEISTTGEVRNVVISIEFTGLINPAQYGGIFLKNYGLVEDCEIDMPVNIILEYGCIGFQNDGLVRNCTATSNGSMAGTTQNQSFGIAINNGLSININTSGSITTGQRGFAGICFNNSLTGVIVGSNSNCNISGVGLGNNNATGGVAFNYGMVRDCSTAGNLEGVSDRNATFCIQNWGTFENCYSRMNISSASSLNNAGFISYNWAGASVINCYYAGVIGGAITKGFSNHNAGVMENSYWDKELSGVITSSGGLGRTTAQMKAGTASSFINADGSVDGGETPANAMYTGWDEDTWSFGTVNDYPTLK